MFPKDPEIERLLRLARSQEIHNEQVAACWPVIIESIDNDWIVPATVKDEWLCSVSVDELISVLSKGSAIGAQEVDFDWDGESAVITFVGVEYRCPRDALITEFQRLKDRYCSELELLKDPLHNLATLLGLTPEELVGQMPGNVQQRLKDAAAEIQSIFQAAPFSGPEGRVDAKERMQELIESLSSRGVLGLDRIDGLFTRFQVALDSGIQPSPKILAGGLRTIADWLEEQELDPNAKTGKWLGERVGRTIARALRFFGIRSAGDE